MNSEVPRIMTSLDTPNFLAVTTVAVLKTLLANVITQVILLRTTVTSHFLLLGQFMGFSGSFGPSLTDR